LLLGQVNIFTLVILLYLGIFIYYISIGFQLVSGQVKKLQLLCSCKVAVRPVFNPKPINTLIYQSYNCTNTKNRIEANYTYIKQYLGSKKTYSNLFNTVAGIEEAVNNQISNIIISTARQQDSILLDIDRKVFRGMFRVVT
jgi:hypothetical protein